MGEDRMAESVNSDVLELTNETGSKQKVHMDDDRYAGFEVDVKMVINHDIKPVHKHESKINGKLENDGELPVALEISELIVLTSESNVKLLPNGNIEKENRETVQVNHIKSSDKPVYSVRSYSVQIPPGLDGRETSAASISESSMEPDQVTKDIQLQYSMNPCNSVMPVAGNVSEIANSARSPADFFNVESNVPIRLPHRPMESKQAGRDIDLHCSMNHSNSVTNTPISLVNAQRVNNPDNFDCQAVELCPSPTYNLELTDSVEKQTGNVGMEHISSKDESYASPQMLTVRSQEMNHVSTDTDLQSMNISVSVSKSAISLTNEVLTTEPVGFGFQEMNQIPSNTKDPELAENNMEYQADRDVEISAESRQIIDSNDLQTHTNLSPFVVDNLITCTCDESITNTIGKEMKQFPSHSDNSDFTNSDQKPAENGRSPHPLYNVSGEIRGLISESSLRNASKGIHISSNHTSLGQENVLFVNTDITGWQHFDAHENVSARNSSVELWEQLLEDGLCGTKEAEVITLHTVSEEPATLENHQFGMPSPGNPFVDGSERTSHFSEADGLHVFGLQHSFDNNNQPVYADMLTVNLDESGSKQTLTNYPSFSDLPVCLSRSTCASNPSTPALNVSPKTNGDTWVATFDIAVPAPQEMSRSVALSGEANDQQNVDNNSHTGCVPSASPNMSPKLSPVMKVVSSVRNMNSFGDEKAAQKSIWTVCFCS